MPPVAIAVRDLAHSYRFVSKRLSDKNAATSILFTFMILFELEGNTVVHVH